MREADKYSCTSNMVKLLKHLDTLKNLQSGTVAPIMVHVIPTHRCHLDCVHCCFKNKSDKTAELDIDKFTGAMLHFRSLGTRAIEFTGGGDPTLWTHIKEAMNLLYGADMLMGIITNGLGGDKINKWHLFDWVRVSLNTLEYRDTLDLSYLKDVHTTLCYIWHDASAKHLEKIVDFANDHQLVCRLAPDCIRPVGEIEKLLTEMRRCLSKFKNNKYVFLSDFNVHLARHSNDCFIHMIKPCLYLDGYLYACPSAELAVENNKQIKPETRLCEWDQIKNYYNSSEAKAPRTHTCSYCKYAEQQEFLDTLLTETEFNEFA